MLFLFFQRKDNQIVQQAIGERIFLQISIPSSGTAIKVYLINFVFDALD